MSAASAEGAIRCLLVRAGEQLCALPLAQVRRVVPALATHPLPGAAPELLGLAEFGGEPLPVFELGRLLGAAPGVASTRPVTVIAWAGPPAERELVGLATDEALSIVDVPMAAVVTSQGGLVRGEVLVDGKAVRVLDLERLGAA